MSRKLTIRRVGNHLPTIILVGFLFFSITLGWLSVVGLPDSLLRKIEAAAAEQGIYLKVDELHLEPTKGLAAQANNIRLYVNAGEQQPLLKADSVTASLHIAGLLGGDVKLKTLRIDKAQADIPVTDTPGTSLELNDFSLSADIDRRKNLHLTSASLNLQGIALRLSGSIELSRLQDESPATTDSSPTAEPINISDLLAQYATYTDKIYHTITEQHWCAHETPLLRAELKLDETPYVTITGEVPRYDFDIFHIRDARLNICYKDNTLTINNLAFSTIDPPSEASLQAAFQHTSRELGFRFASTTSLVPMLRSLLGSEATPILNKITHAPEHAPSIELSGTVSFEENFSPRHIRLNGEMEQKNLIIGEHKIDRLTLAFFYRDGDFNLNKLGLVYGANTLNLSAAASRGKGQAEIQADVNIQETLALVNEFTTEPVSVPTEFTLGDRIQLSGKADLTTPVFEAGQTEWQQFTPDIRNLQLSLKLDSLKTAELTLIKPTVSVALTELVQNKSKMPTGAESARLTFDVEKLDTATACLTGAHLSIGAADIAYTDGKLSIDRLTINPDEATLGKELSFGRVNIREPKLQLTAEQLVYADGQFASSRVEAIAALSGLSSGDISTGKITIKTNDLQQITLTDRNSEPFFSLADVAIELADFTYRGQSLCNLNGHIHATDGKLGSIDLDIVLPGSPRHNTLRAEVDWRDLSHIAITNISADLAPADGTAITKDLQIDIPQIKLPEKLTATGQLVYNSEKQQAKDINIHLNIPELVRTPCRIKAFAGQQVPVGLQADITMQPASEKGYRYTVDLNVTHGADALMATVNGHTDGNLHVTGTNTIRADVVDKLIDSNTAHEIIRDFDFGPQSRNTITGIDVKVDYSEGLKVDSYCNVELRQVGYQLGIIKEDTQGNEKKAEITGRPAYSTAHRATCYVRAKVRYDQKKNGKPLKDECVITIGDIDMQYDNTPWLTYQNFEKLGISREKLAEIKRLYRNTTLRGNAVIIDVENSFVELVNVRGRVYPSYSLGMYYAPLHEFLADICMPYPADIETDSCVFPIYHDCTRPMSGNIRVKSPRDCGFRFLGTTIPLKQFNGFIHLTDDYVLLDRMNAACWQGVLDATVKIGFSGKRTSFDGQVKARNMSLKSILKSYNTTYSDALCNGELRFRSPSPDLNDIQGYGKASIVNGDLMGFTLFQPIGDLVSDLPSNLLMLESSARSKKPGYIAKVFSGTGDAISRIGNEAKIIPGYNHIFAYDIQDAHAKFAISDGKLNIYEMKALGYNLNVNMKLSIDLDTLYIKGNLWPKITSLPTVILSPITFLSDFMIDILIFGEIDSLDWKFGLDRRFNEEEPSASANGPSPKYKPVSEKHKKSGS